MGQAGTLLSHANRHQPVECQSEPAMGSTMDFGATAGDWTLKLSSLSYDWNFVTCIFPNLSTWHSQTMIKETL